MAARTTFRLGFNEITRFESELFSSSKAVVYNNHEWLSEHLTFQGQIREVKGISNRLPTEIITAVKRGTNANELVNPNLLRQEFSERYMWAYVVPKIFSMNKAMWRALQKHKDGLYYIHKMPEAAILPYCMGHSIRRVLLKGLKYHADHPSRPAKHFWTAVRQASNFLMLAQQYFTGAQAFQAIELWLAPLAKKDAIDYERAEREFEGMFFELNMPYRPGAQSPFTNLTITLFSSKSIEQMKPVVGGKEIFNETLGDYREEAKMLLKALFANYRKGDDGIPWTFPIPNILVTNEFIKGIEEDPELFENVWLSAGLMGAPYFENAIIGTKNVLGDDAYLHPEGTFAMCFHKDDRILIRDKEGRVDYIRFEDLFKRFAGERDPNDETGEWFLPKEYFEVLVFDSETGEYRWRKVNAIRRARPTNKKIYKIELTNGSTFRVDAEHQILFYERKYDGKLMKRSMYAKDFYEYVKDKDTYEKNKIKLPVALLDESDYASDYMTVNGIKVDEDLAYLLGVAFAEGSSRFRGDEIDGSIVINLGKNDYELARKVLDILLKYTTPKNIRVYYGKGAEHMIELAEERGIRVKPLLDNESTTGNFRIDVNRDGNIIHMLGVTINKARGYSKIPWFIWSSPKSVRRAFIQGFLDGDGYYRETEYGSGVYKRYEVHLGAPSKEFAKEFVTLALLSGIKATIKFVKDGTVYIVIPVETVTDKSRFSTRLGHMALVAVRNVTEEEYDDYVYDVEADDEVSRSRGELPPIVVEQGSITFDCCRLLVNKEKLAEQMAVAGEIKFEEKSEDEMIALEKEIEKQGGTKAHGVFSTAEATGSKGIITVNLPRMALESKGDIQTMMQRMEEELYELGEMLAAWHKWYLWLRWKGMPNVFKFVNYYQQYEEFKRWFFMAFGAVGMPEMANILADEEYTVWLSDDYGAQYRLVKDYIYPVISKMSEIADELGKRSKELYGTYVPFSVEEVPAETASSKLLRKDIAKFGEETLRKYVNFEAEMYSNTVYPYYGRAPILKIAEMEGMVQPKFTGGVMHHFWLGEQLNDPEAVKKLVTAILSKGVVNFSLSPLVCKGGRCWTRIVGWMRPVDNFSEPRKKEFRTRYFKTFDGIRRHDPYKNYRIIELDMTVDPFANIL